MKKHSLKWFIDRIGKIIFRKDTKKFGVRVHGIAHAKFLEMYQNDLDLFYGDKPFEIK